MPADFVDGRDKAECPLPLRGGGLDVTSPI